MVQGREITRRIYFGLAVLPAIVLAILILKYSVNVPYWDQWSEPGHTFEKIQKGTVSLRDFFEQQNESRTFFPRLIFISLAYLTKWDVRYEMLLTFLSACLVSFNIYRLSCLTLNSSRSANLLTLFFANLVIFTPLQWDNWFWGIQLIVFIPIVCITTSLCIALLRYGMWSRLFICCCLSVVSTFSYANGMLCWLMFLPALVLSPSWKEFKGKGHLLIFWLGAFSLNQFIYFYNYKKPRAHPSMFFALEHPKKALTYFFSFLGSPLCGNNLVIAASAGFFIFSLFTGLCVYLFWRVRKNRTILYQMSSWVILGSYSILSGVITTLGRVGFGIEQSLSSRYIAFSGYLIVAIIYLAVIVATDLKSQNWSNASEKLSNPKIYSFNPREHIPSAMASLATMLVVLHLTASVAAVSSIQTLQRDRLYAKSCLIFFNYVKKDCIVSYLFPVVRDFRKRVPLIDSLGLLEPALAASPEIQQAQPNDTNSLQYGWFDGFENISGNRYLASGWAVLPGKAQPADAVLLTYKNSQGKSIFFSLSPVKVQRADVAEILKQDNYINSGWSTTASTKGLPNGQIEINAWAFDTSTGESYKLGSSHIIQR